MLKFKSLETLAQKYESTFVNPNAVYEIIRKTDTNIIENRIESKHIVPGNEDLSKAVARIIYSGHGFLIMGYVQNHGINRYVEGFASASELFHYANWVIEEHNRWIERMETEFEEKMKMETENTVEERADNLINHLEAKLSIIENMFNQEERLKHISKMKEYESIESRILDFAEVHQKVKMIYDELTKCANLDY